MLTAVTVYVPSLLFLDVYSVEATGMYPLTTETTPSFTVTLQSLRFFLSTPQYNLLVALEVTLDPSYPLIPTISTP